jgi:hypothetical protein
VAWRFSRVMSPRLSMKTQKEEKWAVMGRELLWAGCGFRNEADATSWGAYEGAVKADLDPSSGITAECGCAYSAEMRFVMAPASWSLWAVGIEQ